MPRIQMRYFGRIWLVTSLLKCVSSSATRCCSFQHTRALFVLVAVFSCCYHIFAFRLPRAVLSCFAVFTAFVVFRCSSGCGRLSFDVCSHHVSLLRHVAFLGLLCSGCVSPSPHTCGADRHSFYPRVYRWTCVRLFGSSRRFRRHPLRVRPSCTVVPMLGGHVLCGVCGCRAWGSDGGT